MDRGIGNWARERARLSGDQIALSTKNVAISYTELDTNSNRLATSLVSYGVRRGDRVALFLENSPQWIEILFAVSKLGGVVVPLEASLRVDDLAFVIEDSSPRVLFTSESGYETVQKALKSVSCEMDLIVTTNMARSPVADYSALLARGKPRFESNHIDDTETAMLAYTASQALRPQAVQLSHRNLESHTVSMIATLDELSSNDDTLTAEPLSSVLGLTTFVLPLLYLGGTVHIEHDLGAFSIADAINRTQPTALSMSYRNWQEIARRRALVEPVSLRYALVTEGVLGAEESDLLYSMGIDPRRTYGLSEASGIVTVDNPWSCSKDLTSRGKAIFGTEIHGSFDSKQSYNKGGRVSEISIASRSVTKGYWLLPYETSKVIGDGVLRTGEIGTVDALGNLHLESTSERWQKIGGRLSHKELEVGLASEEFIGEVVAIDLSQMNGTDAFLIAVTPSDHSSFSETELRRRLKDQWSLEGVNIEIMVLDEMPRSASGKLLRSQIARMFFKYTGTHMRPEEGSNTVLHRE
ncbi:Acyl-CoA synthetase (AMP-forming)/AMP-acid ligase II [Ferrithrix thermotolerans DSM 19514]|uniref:Acyl-CoA synthetase (AMP-forming)/AMP-acid ligase II n=1 Tax=Ferrithrix thermotolerans DSM 19514 TaxID=1121881 RepID=A0A1M4VWZ1_9ACTN|nr:class I adenylate-forming enzyme family protein [Ferrithrix thermotolerans]SHE73544.1 Acyl-CoA synthetase (AMP-forming)/AMP-acid ligase II [Ferrithrix thermotolerans DSM 19514]